MKASELVKKLGSKLLGKNVKPSAGETNHAAAQVAPDAKAPGIALLDRLGVIQLPENWRN